jgi:glycosyltransferase involved in cell wall biosynthesis
VDIAFSARKQQAMEAADRVICISETTRQDVLAAYAVEADRVQVACLAHSALFKRAAGQVNPLFPEPFVLYVGSRTHYKNFDFLLSAYARWAQRDAIYLVVVGGRWTKAEERLLQQYGLMDRVRLLSGVGDAQLAVLYNTALAFVYPSLYEGFGIPLLEAMACGCPVVTSDIPASREVTDGCAFYFDPSSPESLHEALDKVMQSEVAALMVAQAERRAEQFSWEASGRTILDLLRQLSPSC